MSVDKADNARFFRVEVMAAAHLWQPLSYRVTPDLAALIQPLGRLMVPLRSRLVLAFALNYPEEDDGGSDLKLVADVLDSSGCPAFPPEMLEFLQKTAAYYQMPLGQALSEILPAGLGQAERKPPRCLTMQIIAWRADAPDLKPQSKAANLLALLKEQGPMALPALSQRWARPGPLLRQLESRGLVTVSHKPVVRDLMGQPFMAEPKPKEFTPAQSAALGAILPAIKEKRFAPFLLQGITGSGKTEVYMAAMEAALAAGRSCLILSPEIGLCLRLEGLIKDRFPSGLSAILHSGLSSTARRMEWEAAARGRARLVLGARSAVFAPLSDLGLIVVDEEHDEAYKQEDHLRYNARDLALLRGQTQQCPVILGSATPAVTTYERAERGVLAKLVLPERVGRAVLPRMEVVDLRTAGPLMGGFLSKTLFAALHNTVNHKRQAMVFLNRRGYAPALLCPACGHRLGCPACSLSLTLHLERRRLVCHTCGHERGLPGQCPACQSPELKPLGWGTEAVAVKLKELAPDWRILRLDRDTAPTPARLSALLRKIAQHEVDVVVGTQMLSKGHHFPLMGLVGVLLADQALSLPDFRAAERAYTLLTQVSGRAGRAEEQGAVIVQTYDPHHHALKAAVNNEPQAFYHQELEERRNLGYPPFARLMCLRLDGPEERVLKQAAAEFVQHLHKAKAKLDLPVRILGPAPAPVAKIQNRYRYLILLKSAQTSMSGQVLRRALHAKGSLGAMIRLSIDVDPLSLV